MCTTKLIFLNELENSNIFDLRIYDLDEEKLYIRNCNLRVLNSLKGISQYSGKNCLYLCGANEEDIEPSNANTNFQASPRKSGAGSYLIQLVLTEELVMANVLVNSTYNHYLPMMVVIEDSIVIVVGGKGQTMCEKYSIEAKKWGKMASLPEERYQGNILYNNHNFCLYLFGGKSVDNKYYGNVLCYNLRTVGNWNSINVDGKPSLLKRTNLLSFHFNVNNDDIIYLCGGRTKVDEDADAFIMEYNYNKNTIKKKDIPFKNKISTPEFNSQTVITDPNKFNYVFADSKDNIYILDRRNFKISIINSNEV